MDAFFGLGLFGNLLFVLFAFVAAPLVVSTIVSLRAGKSRRAAATSVAIVAVGLLIGALSFNSYREENRAEDKALIEASRFGDHMREQAKLFRAENQREADRRLYIRCVFGALPVFAGLVLLLVVWRRARRE